MTKNPAKDLSKYLKGIVSNKIKYMKHNFFAELHLKEFYVRRYSMPGWLLTLKRISRIIAHFYVYMIFFNFV